MNRDEIIQEKFAVSKLLLNEFERLVDQLKSNQEKMPELIAKAYDAQIKMIIFYNKWDKPSEMTEQLEQMSAIIKKMEQLHINPC